jgi:hypothetical protein
VETGDISTPYQHFKTIGVKIGLGRVLVVHNAKITDIKERMKHVREPIED